MRSTLLGVCVCLVACGGDKDSDTDGTGSGTLVETADTAPPPFGVTNLDLQPILNANCGPCHLDGQVTQGLNLDNVLGTISRPSAQSGLRLVEPGDAERSYLIHKLRGTQIEVGGGGQQMPQGGRLTANEIELFEVWINEGCTVGEEE